MPPYEPPSYLSPSGAEDLARCPARYELSHLMRLRQPGYVSPLTLGSATHAAARHLRESADPGAVDQAIAIGQGIIETDAAKHDYDCVRDVAKLRAMVAGYHEALEPLRTELNEIPLSAPVRNGDAQICAWLFGYADAFVKGGRYVFELKTTSDTLNEVESTLRAGLQVPFYLYAAELYGLAPLGAICDVIKKPVIAKRKNESTEDWSQRALEAYQADPGRFFRRIVIDYDEACIAAAMDKYVYLSKMQKYYLQHGFVAVPGQGCKGPFGWCYYRGLCWFDRADEYVIRP